jgi:hypothetical protein
MSAIFDTTATSTNLSMWRRTVLTQTPSSSLSIAGTTYNSQPRTRKSNIFRNIRKEGASRSDSQTFCRITDRHSSQSQSACQRSGVPWGASAAVLESDISVFPLICKRSTNLKGEVKAKVADFESYL